MANKGLDIVQVKLVMDKTLYSEEQLSSPDQVVQFMRKELSEYDREVFCILNCTTKSQVINMNIVSMGTINASLAVSYTHLHMQFFLQRLLEDLLQKEITEEERVYLIVHISRTTQSGFRKQLELKKFKLFFLCIMHKEEGEENDKPRVVQSKQKEIM